MAHIYADRVQETTTTHSGTGTVTLDGATSGYRAFSEVGDGNTCTYLIVGATATEWEIGIGTYTATGTTLSRDTVLSSSTGAAVAFTSGVHTVSLVADAKQIQNGNLRVSAHTLTTAGLTGVVGTMHACNISALDASGGDVVFTLPATAAVGDRVGLMVTTNAPATVGYELLIKPATGDTINGGTAGAEWSRLLIAGEVVEFVCTAADSAWIVERDGRIPCLASLSLSANRPTTNTAATDTDLQFDQASPNNGGCYSTSNYRWTARRACSVFVTTKWTPVNAVTDQDYAQINFKKNGAVNSGAGVRQSATSSLMLALNARCIPDVAAGDYIQFYYRTESASIGALASSSTGAATYGFAQEILT